MIPPHGRVVGVDYGTVRIGLAVSDADRIVSSPLTTYERKSPADDDLYFQKLVTEERVVGFVVGLAILLNDDEGPKARECRTFGTRLAEVTKLPVEYQDERFTTADAEDQLLAAGMTNKRRKAKRDRVAATLILEAWLQASRNEVIRKGLS